MTLGSVRPDCWDVDSYFVQVQTVQAAFDSNLLGRDISVTGHSVDHQQFDKASDMFVATSGTCKSCCMIMHSFFRTVRILHILLLMMHDMYVAERTALVVRFHDFGVSEMYRDKFWFRV